MTNQAIWKFIGNLGDINPIEHGGLFVYIDETGHYSPEAVLLHPKTEKKYEVRRFSIENCTYTNGEDLYKFFCSLTSESRKNYRFNDYTWDQLPDFERTTWNTKGILSDNKFHPLYPAWFAKPESEKANRPQDTTYLSNISRQYEKTNQELIAGFLSSDPLARAKSWEMVGVYHGWDNLDSYPQYLTRKDVLERFKVEIKNRK